jgi:DNA/RNA endonuclease YhcR with UshA esterase domain
MKKIIATSILATGLLLGANYTTDQAANHIGENATVCGIVTGGKYAKSSRGKPTFINMDGRYPYHKFTILIWGENRHNFNSPEKRLNGKKVCVTGFIDSYKGIPQIEVSSKSQMK